MHIPCPTAENRGTKWQKYRSESETALGDHREVVTRRSMGQHPATRQRNAQVLLPFVARCRFSSAVASYPVLFPVHLLRLHNGGKSTSVHGGDTGTHRRLGSSASATLSSATAAAPQTGATDVMAVRWYHSSSRK